MSVKLTMVKSCSLVEKDRKEQRRACLRALCVSQYKLGVGKLEGHNTKVCSEHLKSCLMVGNRGRGYFTSHIFLTFENDERITSMRFLLLVGFFVGVGILDDSYLGEVSKKHLLSLGETYTLNGSKSPKLTLQVAFIRFVAEARDNHSLESIATNIWVLVWLV